MSALSSSAQTRNTNRGSLGNCRITQSANPTTNAITTVAPPESDTPSLLSRQRQSKKDEVIRKKIEHELLRKKHQRGAARDAPRQQQQQQQQQQHKRIAGTVAALKPEIALTVKETTLVMEAAQLMAAKRRDCILVVDDKEHLCGIFTAKDLAYRVIASHVDARSITVASIMTRGPMCVTSDMSTQDALQLMVTRGIRHLPVCNDDADIFGLLNISRCIYDALGKMDRAYESLQKLYDALESVEREWPVNSSPLQFAQHMEALRYRMACPSLMTVVEDHHRAAPPVQVSIKAQVRDVARMMKAYRTTAALVMDHGDIAGIFTTKDIVLRVIAAGLNPDNCSVVRVMTPHPDTVTPSTSILDALKKMHTGRYLNLPVVDEKRNLIDVVDVLRLTRVALVQINDIKGPGPGDTNATGIKWFWNTIAAMSHYGNMDPDGLMPSETLCPHAFVEHPPTLLHLAESQKPAACHRGLFYPHPPSSADPMATPLTFSSDTDTRSVLSLSLELASSHPSTSTTTAFPAHGPHPTTTTTTTAPTTPFSFKFSDGRKTYRFRCDATHFATLEQTVRQKWVGASATTRLTLSYRDDEGDEVVISSNADLLDAVELARKAGDTMVRLMVHEENDHHHHHHSRLLLPELLDPHDETEHRHRGQRGSHDDTMHEEHTVVSVASSVATATATATTARWCDQVPHASACIVDDVDDEVENLWIADQMVLPTTITFLGMAILGAFTL